MATTLLQVIVIGIQGFDYEITDLYLSLIGLVDYQSNSQLTILRTPSASVAAPPSRSRGLDSFIMPSQKTLFSAKHSANGIT